MGYQSQLPSNSLFSTGYPREAIAALDALVASKTPIFVMPSWYLSTEAAQVGYLLSAVISARTGQQGPYRCFFANSTYEAIHAAVKLMRHWKLDGYAHHQGRILVLDPDTRLSAQADPLNRGPELALAPNLVFARKLSDFERLLSDRNWCGIIIRSANSYSLGSLAKLLDKPRADDVPITLDVTDSDLSERSSPALNSLRPDLILVGEALTRHQVPFAAVCGTSRAFEVWSQPGTAFLHSNTYGGNTLAMRLVRDHLLVVFPADDAVRSSLVRARSSRRHTLELYARHVNPVTAYMHKALRGALNVVRAEATTLTIELDSGKTFEIVDCICAGGLGVNGHNPDDARTSVLRKHDPGIDYIALLEAQLAQHTGLSKAFPTVSGATAVETAITLAMLARPERRKIIVFNHNYGGKTLISLLATAAERSRRPFAPLYEHVCYLDPFASDAIERFKKEVATGDVALVWLEIVHGSSESFAPLPDPLLRAVSEQRSSSGYLIGVDEVLMSYFRSGRRFSYCGRIETVDLVSFSKALSYLCFPIGAAVVSDAVYQAARSINRELVDNLKSQYRNNLGAQFALHSLFQVGVLGLADRSRAVSARLRKVLGEIKHRTIARSYSEGLFVRFEVRPPRLPKPWRAAASNILPIAVMIWWITRARVLALYDCMGPHLISTDADIRRVEAGLERLARTSPLSLILQALAFQAVQSAAGAFRSLRTARSGKQNEILPPSMQSGIPSGPAPRGRADNAFWPKPPVARAAKRVSFGD